MTAVAHLPAAVAPKIAKLIPMLGTSNDGEALAACRAMGRALHAAGSDFHALAAAIRSPLAPVIPPSPATALWSAIVGSLSEHRGLTAREAEFVASVGDMLRRGRMLSERQKDWLRAIHGRINPEAAET